MASKRRDHLVQTALDLFQRDGFHATGIDKILAESGVAKMTLYNHFRSKEELILACVRRTDEAWRNAVMKKIENSSKDPRGRLLAVFDAVEDMIEDDRFCGCFFVRAANEFREPEDPIRAAAAENKRLFTNYMARIAKDAGAAKPEDLAKSLLMLLDGAIAYAHVSGDAKTPTLARQNAELLIGQYLS